MIGSAHLVVDRHRQAILPILIATPICIDNPLDMLCNLGMQPVNHVVHPERELSAFGRAFPGVWNLVDIQRIQGAKARDTWPSWCYLPYERAHDVMSKFAPRLPSEFSRTITSPIAQISEARRILAYELCLLSAWRHTKGIYRFNPALYDKVIDTPLDSELPCELLLRLPEWAVTIETPGLLLHDTIKSHVMLTVTLRASEPIVLINCNLFSPIILPLTRQSVAAALAHAHASGAIRAVIEPFVRRALTLAIFLCCEEPDLSGGTDRRSLGVTKTRHGNRFFPPGQVQTWDVGSRIGAALRAAEKEWEDAEAAAGPGEEGAEARRRARPRPHFRSAHDRRVWVGSGDNARAVWRWFPVQLVNANTSSALIETIRPVKKDKDTK